MAKLISPLEILKLLEKSNCRECGQATCLAFAAAVFKGQILAAVSAAGQATGRRIFAVGPAATVRVVPPPEPSAWVRLPIASEAVSSLVIVQVAVSTTSTVIAPSSCLSPTHTQSLAA